MPPIAIKPSRIFAPPAEYTLRMGQTRVKVGKLKMLLLPALVAAINILILIYPRESLAAARNGLELWAFNVLPGMLPFVIGANLLMSLGVVSFLGVALGPAMRRIFGLPGTGGFALAVGLVSGYPIGAKVVCEMRLRGELGRSQAQRLLAFANNGGPLFILGAVAAGMFGSASLGYFLLAIHYLGALLIGLIIRLIWGNAADDGKQAGQMPLHAMMVRAMSVSRRKDGRSLGQMLGQAVANAVETMLTIGGFVVLFSVVTAVLGLAGVYDLAGRAAAPLFDAFGVSAELQSGFFAGLVEMANGIGMLSAHGVSRAAVALTAGVLGFGGASILLQSASFIGKTDLSTRRFVAAKAAHGVLSAIMAAVLFPLFVRHFAPQADAQAQAVFNHSPAASLVRSTAHFAAVVAVLAVVAAIVVVARLAAKKVG